MPNTILTPTKIAREAIMLLKNQLGVANMVHRDYIRDMYDPKSGGTVTIRKPAEFSVTDGATLSNQDATEYSVVIPAPSQKHVAMRFSSQELTLEVEDFSARYVMPAVTQLVNQVEYDILGLYNQIPNSVGTPGTTPGSFSAFASAMQRLDEYGVENADRCICINPAARASMADALKGLDSSTRPQDALRRGDLGQLADMRVFMSQNVRTHTAGTFSTGSTGVTNGASSAGDTTLTTDGWAASTLVLTAGDIFTIAGVNAVNPRNKQDLGRLRQFVAQEDVTSDGSGNATIRIMDSTSCGLQASGAFQNVTALPGDGVAINAWAANGGHGGAATEGSVHDTNLAFHKNALALVFFNIETPSSAKGWTESDPDSGLSVRVIADYDVTNDREVYRLDILYSVDCLDPDRAVRLVG